MSIINGIYLFVSHSEIFYKNLLKTSRKYSEKYILAFGIGNMEDQLLVTENCK
jgi:hypothetical protein